MTPADWLEIERIYLMASDLPPENRAAYLDQECAGVPELREEVESMLAADSASTGFFDAPPSRLAADLLAANPGTLAPGERVGDYQVRSLISIGGMGEVYLADDVRQRRPVALKLIRRHLLADVRAAERFASEARAAGALQHPNVIAIYEFGKSEVGMFLAMEWVDGPTWRAVMRAGRQALPDAAAWSRQAALGLAAAHEAGITHRDVKPENLMLSRDGVVKILDFGLARLVDSAIVDIEASGASGTISGTLSGTLSYMPPELFRGEPATCATDVFSLGSVFYELFCGVHPFAGETPLDVYEAIECRVPETPSGLRTGIPEEVDGLLLRMLDRNRERRPEAAEVASALEDVKFAE
jgi:serine/threonine-protein kinase